MTEFEEQIIAYGKDDVRPCLIEQILKIDHDKISSTISRARNQRANISHKPRGRSHRPVEATQWIIAFPICALDELVVYVLDDDAVQE